MAKNKIKTPEKVNTPKASEPMVFGKSNFVLMGISAVVILIGFFLMRGSEDVVDVKSMKLTVAPVVVILGFVLAIYSVVKKDKEVNS
jgi:uncharacterized Tic20 family protein